MPYIITTTAPSARSIDGQRDVGYLVTRRAVATLEETRAAVWTQVFDSGSRRIDGSEVDALPESGGTIGPLPNGTVIEVRRVRLLDLAVNVPGDTLGSEAAIIDAYNAAQGGNDA
jgi:hypothetical protein